MCGIVYVSCAGRHLAMPFLKVMVDTLRNSPQGHAFTPSVGHLYSGRHLDGVVSVADTLYFISKAFNLLTHNHPIKPIPAPPQPIELVVSVD